MYLKLFTTAAAIAMLPLVAQAQQRQAPPAQQKAAKVTPAEVQRVAKIVGADPAKKRSFCELTKLEGEIADADEKKDTKKVEELSKKAEELSQKVGPEYAKLMEGLEQIQPESAEGKRIGAAMEQFDKLCAPASAPPSAPQRR